MLSGIPLSNAASEELMRIARRMARADSRESHIRMDDAEGYISTAFKHATMGGLSGMIFDAVLETERGTTDVRYLVRTVDLASDEETGEWTEWRELPPSGPLYN